MGQVCWVRFAGQGFVGFNAGGGGLLVGVFQGLLYWIY